MRLLSLFLEHIADDRLTVAAKLFARLLIKFVGIDRCAVLKDHMC